MHISQKAANDADDHTMHRKMFRHSKKNSQKLPQIWHLPVLEANKLVKNSQSTMTLHTRKSLQLLLFNRIILSFAICHVLPFQHRCRNFLLNCEIAEKNCDKHSRHSNAARVFLCIHFKEFVWHSSGSRRNPLYLNKFYNTQNKFFIDYMREYSFDVCKKMFYVDDIVFDLEHVRQFLLLFNIFVLLTGPTLGALFYFE